MLQANQNLKRSVSVWILLCLTWGGAVTAYAQDSSMSRQPYGLDRVGIYPLRSLDPSLDGQNVQYAVIARSKTYYQEDMPAYDYLPQNDHQCFRDTLFQELELNSMATGYSPHATAVCSILFGRDTDASHVDLGRFIYEGAVPGAQVQVYEFEQFMYNSLASFVKTGVLPEKGIDFDVVTLSCGHEEESWYSRGMEMLVDRSGVVVVASIGNGSSAQHGLLYPGAAANLIGVGVVDSVKTNDTRVAASQFGRPYPKHSSSGPTLDGRCKPDIVAPGNCLIAVADTGRYEMAGNWTSFAAPVVAGVTGQLIQKAQQTPGLELAAAPEAGGRVIKALLMTSAKKLPHWHKGRLGLEDDTIVPLDYTQGAGVVDAVGAYHLLNAGQQEPGVVGLRGWDLNTVNRLEENEKTYSFVVEDEDARMITATLVWNRQYEDALDLNDVNLADLRLELWAIHPEDAALNQRVLSDSAVDNIEHIYTKTIPGYHQYELVVALNDDTAPEAIIAETFSVAWNVEAVANEDDILWHDLNSDGVVDQQDEAVLLANLEVQHDDNYAIGDFNGDGLIDDVDMQHLRRQVVQ